MRAQGGVKNAPKPPPPSSGESSISDSSPTVTGGPCSDVSEDVDQDRSNSEDDSVSGLAQEKALVRALITAVRDTLKIQGTAGASAEVAVPQTSPHA